MSYETGALLATRYRLEARLGEGASGIVFRARDLDLNRDVAVKILNLAAAQNPTLIARFEREARALSELLHPGIVRVYRYGLDGNSPFLVMEFSEGENLHSYIERRKRLPCDEALAIAIQLASAIEYAHSAGVVHRDLKPENIQLKFENGAPVVKVLDFGLCKRDEAEGEQSLTKTGHLLGTAMYMSPEQCTGKPVDKRSDVYSFGCILFEMITGSPPFDGATHAEILLRQLSDPLPRILELSPESGLPLELQDFLITCTEKNREERFQSFSDLKHALAELEKLGCRKTFVPGRATGRSGKLRLPGVSRKLLLTVIASLFILAAGTCYLFFCTKQGKSLLLEQVQQNMSASDSIETLTRVLEGLFKSGDLSEAEKTMRASVNTAQFRKWRSLERQHLLEKYISICEEAKETNLAFEYRLLLLQESLEDVQQSLRKKTLPERDSSLHLDAICRAFIEGKLSKRQWSQVAHVFLAKWNLDPYRVMESQFWWWWLKTRCESLAQSLNSRDVAKDYYLVVELAIRKNDPDLVARSASEALAFARKYEEHIRSSNIRVLLGTYYLHTGRLQDARSELQMALAEAEGRDLSESERDNLNDFKIGCQLGRAYSSTRNYAERSMNGLYRILLDKRED